MTIPAQGGVFSIAMQAAKVGAGGTFTPGSLTWYKMRAPRVALGTIQQQEVFPLEIGGSIVPTGAFKSGYFFAGEVDLLPRVENTLGWLLKAALGAVTTATDELPDGSASVGVNSHVFHFDPASSFNQPWMAMRRLVPGQTAAQNFGETGFDCKVNSLQFTVPASGKIALRLSAIGRDVQLITNPTWTYGNAAYEDSTSVPDAGRGSFTIAGTEYPILGAQIQFANNLTTPDQERIIGDFRPDDFVSLTRGATIRIVYKYEDADLFKLLLGNDANATAWSSMPYLTDTAGAVPAFEGIFQAPANIGATTVPYELRITANRVVWAVDGPIELQAGGIVTQTLVGTVLEPETGDYLTITLVNDAAAY